MTHDNTRPEFDAEIQAIARYVLDETPPSQLALETARYDLLDSIACALMALEYPQCTKLIGPIVPGATLENGARVLGTAYSLDPVQAAFNNGALIRWLDFNDTWLAAEWGHPSDNLGAILSVADYLSQQSPISVKTILNMMVKAHEIQGVLALENSFNRVGLDHVILVKLASTAVSCALQGLKFETTCNALSLAFVDGQSLRTYRHAPNTGSRKSWAAGDACSRAVQLSLLAAKGEMGYPSAISAPTWGFSDVLFKHQPLVVNQAYGSYVMENILFKISFPAEFHAQTAVEAAIELHSEVIEKLDHIDKIILKTQESAVRIIDKKGPLYNPADRDHCLQYMVAIGLLFGNLTAEHYEDTTAQDPRIDQLRDKMQVIEAPRFSEEYLDPNKRAIGNAIQVFYKDGSSSNEVSIDYPIGHRCRRQEGIPILLEKFKTSVRNHFEDPSPLIELADNPDQLDDLSADQLMEIFSIKSV